MVERYRPGATAKSLGKKLFKEGESRPPNSGRKPGVRNKTTALIKDAISGACEKLGELEPIYNWVGTGPSRRKGDKIIGWRATGKGGATGYMIWLGKNYPNAFATLVGRMIPLQVNATATIDTTVTSKYSDVDINAMTLEEKQAAFREMIGLTRALPPPDVPEAPRMLEGTATRVGERYGDDEDSGG